MPPESSIDKFVEALAQRLNDVGLNGTRLVWRWRHWRSARTEAAARRQNRLKAVTGRHKMCPACRGLVAGGETMCPECGASLAKVAAPGAGRFIANSLPAFQSFTALVVTANVAIYVLMGASSGFASSGGGGLFSLFGFDGATLARFGMGAGPWVAGRGETWRLLTPLFLHAGLIHLFFNCYVLMQVGRLIEDEFGGPRSWVIYLVSGLAGGLASNFLRPLITGNNVPYVGASGAVFGLIGLAMIYGWRRGGPQGNAIRRAMMSWTLYILIFGFLVGADNFAHIGGLLAGATLGLLVEGGPLPARSEALWRAGAVAGVAACLWAFFMAAIHGAEVLM